MLASIGCVGTSFRILRKSFFGLISKRGKESTAVFNLPGMCAMVKLNCSRQSHAFQNGGGIILV